MGLTIAPVKSLSEDWQILVENYITGKRTEFLRHGNSVTVDYVFKTNFPAWQVGPAIHAIRTNVILGEHDFEVFGIGLQGNINYIPFYKEYNEMPKAVLLLQFSPGIDLLRFRYTETTFEDGIPNGQFKKVDKKWAFNTGLNALLQINLTTLLSVSPTVGIRYFPNLEWQGITEVVSDGDFQDEFDRVNWQQFTYGLRIGINLRNRK